MYLSWTFLSILQKLGHRLSALYKTTWSEQTKDEIKQVMTVEYTSSDESSYEPDSDSEVPQLQNYKVKHLKWERARLKSVKQTLDNIYFKSLPRRIRQSLVPRVPHSQESDREMPLNGSLYLCRVSPQYQSPLWAYGKPGNPDPEPEPESGTGTGTGTGTGEINEWFKLGSMIDINTPPPFFAFFARWMMIRRAV